MFNKLRASLTGNFRLRRIFYTAVSILATKGVTTIVAFISLPLTLNYLGKERFGMMMTIVSIFTLMNFADLGLGYGLQNRLPEFEKKENLLIEAISSTFFFLCIVACLLLGLFLVIHPYISWHAIFNVSSELAISEASTSAKVFFLCFIFGIPVSIVRKVQGGFQEGYYNQIWLAIGSVAGLCALYYAIGQEWGVPYIILCIYGANTIFLLLNFLAQFTIKRRHLFPKWRSVKTGILKVIAKDGFLFIIVQILFLIMVASDNIIISHIIGPEEVAVFAIGLKLAQLMAEPVLAVMNPSLPAINDAIEKNDKLWIEKLFKKGLKISLFTTSVLSIFFYLSANFIITYWMGSEHIFSFPLLLGFAIYVFYNNLNPFFSFFMLSKPMLKKIVRIYPFATILTIIAKIVFCYYYGLPGLLIATAIMMTTLFQLPSFLTIKNMVSKNDEEPVATLSTIEHDKN